MVIEKKKEKYNALNIFVNHVHPTIFVFKIKKQDVHFRFHTIMGK